MPQQESLKQTAENEANLAEADYANLTPKERAKAKRKKTKPNGKAKANGGAAVTSKPGEQGSATQEAETKSEAPPIWTRPDVTKKDQANAEQLLHKLRSDAQDMKPEAVIDSLIAVVDVHKELTIPHQWPGEASEEYRHAPTIEAIGLLLCRGCPKIEISGRKVGFLWRNKKTWTKKGANVEAMGKSYGALLAYHSNGFNAAVIVNFQIFRMLNTRQKVRALYKALRCLDENGTVIANQFEGFYDELELFGTGTSPEDHRLATAVVSAQQRELPFADIFEDEAD
ncbi:MAG: hypothetical protein V3T08_09265 [Gemmatimonadota bacterium]